MPNTSTSDTEMRRTLCGLQYTLWGRQMKEWTRKKQRGKPCNRDMHEGNLRLSVDILPTSKAGREELEQSEEREGKGINAACRGSSWNKERVRGFGPHQELESVLHCIVLREGCAHWVVATERLARQV